MAKKDRLSIAPCIVDASGNVTVEKGKAFELMLNPSEYNHSRSIDYSKRQALGQIGSTAKFSGIKPEGLKFSFVIDATGVVPGTDESNGVNEQVKKLMGVVYNYDGEQHEPNHVRVLWGSHIFFGRLESISVDNTLFKPSGIPIRAKLELSFTGFLSKEEEALRANRSSPDLSHMVEVVAGDTLPLLCYRIYKDCSYYADVARINGITNIRDIKPGIRLHFPPLR